MCLLCVLNGAQPPERGDFGSKWKTASPRCCRTSAASWTLSFQQPLGEQREEGVPAGLSNRGPPVTFPDGKQGAGRFNLDATPLGGGKRRTSIEKEITRRGETLLNGYEVLR